MAEYYAVLSKAVAGLEANSADTRRAVYDKARNALIGQLKAIDPPLPTAEISRQRLELEEAIRRVERETSAVPSGSPVRVAGGKRTPPAEQPPRPSPQDVFRRAIHDAESTGGESQRMERAPVAARADDWSSDRIERPPPAKPVPQYLPSQGFVEEAPRGDEPRLAPDYDYDWDPKDAPQAAPRAAGPSADNRDRQANIKLDKRGKVPRGRGDVQDMMEQPVRPSRLPTILLLVLIVAMVGGLGALAWSQRSILADLVRQFDSKSPPAATQAAVDPDSLVAQRATLYEEPLNSGAAANGVVAINAAVTWSFVQGGADGPEIVGNVDVPERGLKIKLTLRRNTDQTLPASHVVEVVLDVPSNFPGKGIRDVPRIVLKPSEEARGQPLIGASAKVADGFFWIALSGQTQDVAANLKLLKERGWIDLPLLYDSGQRAIITVEKGTPGERVFEKALTAWTG